MREDADRVRGFVTALMGDYEALPLELGHGEIMDTTIRTEILAAFTGYATDDVDHLIEIYERATTTESAIKEDYDPTMRREQLAAIMEYAPKMRMLTGNAECDVEGIK